MASRRSSRGSRAGLIEIEGMAQGAGRPLAADTGEEGVAMAVDHGGPHFRPGGLHWSFCSMASLPPSPGLPWRNGHPSPKRITNLKMALAAVGTRPDPRPPSSARIKAASRLRAPNAFDQWPPIFESQITDKCLHAPLARPPEPPYYRAMCAKRSGARVVGAQTDVRALARRLRDLPRLRTALASGRLSLSVVELVARLVTPEDEAE